jgi:hypothetical protein
MSNDPSTQPSTQPSRPVEHRTGHHTDDCSLARCGHRVALVEERRLLAEHGVGVTVGLDIERTTRPPVTPIEMRRALERLLRAALDDVAAAGGA